MNVLVKPSFNAGANLGQILSYCPYGQANKQTYVLVPYILPLGSFDAAVSGMRDSYSRQIEYFILYK